jgi:hypothetical protein
MADAITDFIEHLRRRQANHSTPLERLAAAAEAINRALVYETVNVLLTSHPKHPGTTHIEITGPTSEDVQLEIDRVARSVERDGGLANFIGPGPVVGGYKAMGVVKE